MAIKSPNRCTPLINIYRAGNLKTLLDITEIKKPGNVSKINRIILKIKNKYFNNIR